MSARDVWAGLAGEWVGTKRLWLSPEDPVRESESTASLAQAAKRRFATLRYTWSEGGEPQEGFLLFGGLEVPEGPVAVAWVDSWHQGKEIMLARGELAPDGVVSVYGAYSAPPDPDWGWRIVLRPGAGSTFELAMYNIPPEGQEELAVQAIYTRAG